MDTGLSGRAVIDKLSHLIGRITQKRHPNISSSTKTLHREIYEIERALVNRTYQNSRDTRPLEPVTEQQKIIDLAG